MASKLGQLLSYLERPDVTELVFRSGNPAMMQVGHRQHPITISPLRIDQICRLFTGTPVLEHLPTGPYIGPQLHRLVLVGVPYNVTIRGHRAAIEVRVGRITSLRVPPMSPGDSTDPTRTNSKASDPPKGSRGERPTPYLVPDRRILRTGRHAIVLPPVDPLGPVRRRDEVSGSYPTNANHLEFEHRQTSETALPPKRQTLHDEGIATVVTEPSETPDPDPPLPPLQETPNPLGERSILPTQSNPALMPSLRPSVRRPSTGRVPTLRPSERPRTGTPPERRPTHTGPRTRTPIHPGLRQILSVARQQDASDVHIVANAPVRLRRAGALESTGLAVSTDDVQDMVASLLSSRHTQMLKQHGYTDLSAELEDAGRVRLNVSRQRGGMKICARMVNTEPPSLDELGLPPQVRSLVSQHQGLVIVTGPRGHGKSTTLAALVDLFNASHPLHIVTIEDPVEITHPRKQGLVTQREVGTHSPSFRTAITAALREDPDVLAIGELRDRDTIALALEAAHSGPLVLTTMSAPSARAALRRLIDRWAPHKRPPMRNVLAHTIKLVIGQRLLPRADHHGLVAAYEILSGEEIGGSLGHIDQPEPRAGRVSLDWSLTELVDAGIVTASVAQQYAEDSGTFTPVEPPVESADLSHPHNR